MTEGVIKNIRKRWLYSIFELSHIEFQKKVWVEASIPNVVSSFTEAVCCYYDDLDLDSGYESFMNDRFISKREFEIASHDHHLFVEYIFRPDKESLSDAKVIRDPDWHRVVEAMLLAWNGLKSLVNEQEHNYMNELEAKYY